MKVGTDGVLLGAWAEADTVNTRSVLDIGTGSGLIALMLAQRLPEALVVGIDVVPEAVEAARRNAAASPFSGRVRIEAVSLQTFTCDTPFDAITCNPPYYDNSLNCPDESRNTARHTTSLSYAELITHSKRLLSDDGTLNLVLPTDCLKSIELECAYASMFITDRL
ncbi:MAG: methyltransferase, partial [Alloprevotella sp.]|nr:methyltransferase [Alloprevotella sp.]